MIIPNFSQQSITTGKSIKELETKHNNRLIKFKNEDDARKEEIEKLFGKGEKQDKNE